MVSKNKKDSFFLQNTGPLLNKNLVVFE
jgi:hypothetical protein